MHGTERSHISFCNSHLQVGFTRLYRLPTTFAVLSHVHASTTRMLPQRAYRVTLTLTLTRIPTPTRHVSTTTAKVPAPPPSGGKPVMKHPTRGGQNLTDRYRRLEKSLRGKGSYQKDISHLVEEGATLSKPHKSGPAVRTFMGFVVPEVPKPPASDDCCMSGCAVCVYDLYEEAQDEYKKALEHLRASLASLNVPEDQWPEDIQRTASDGNAKSQRKLNPTLSAFEEFEARLKQKHSSSSGPAQPKDVAAASGGLKLSRRARRRKELASDIRSIYEGVRWVLFSNR